jgi:hypothetical protein
MDKKIAIPAGLAVLVVMAVVGMLSIFNMTSVQTVEASLENVKTTENLNIGLGVVTDKVSTITLSASPSLVGDNSRLTITFITSQAEEVAPGNAGGGLTNNTTVAGPGDLIPGSGEISIRFDSSKFKLPATIASTSVTISASSTNYNTAAENPNVVVNPASATVSYTGAEGDLPVLTLVVPDMDPDTDGSHGIGSNVTVTIVILQSAGITIPVKAGGYDISVNTTNDGSTVWSETGGDELDLYRDVTFSAVSGERGDSVTATASGYASGSATFWRDQDLDGVRDSGETDLCEGDVSSSVATCDFTIGNPPFVVGTGTVTCTVFANTKNPTCSATTNANVLQAVDGENNVAVWSSDEDLAKGTFELEGGISITPSSANPGDTVTIQITDGEAGTVDTCYIVAAANDASCSGTIPSSGSLDVTATIPDGVPSGTQKFYILDGGDTVLKANITIGSASVSSTPSVGAVANQRITMSGSGFTASSTVRTILLAGETIHTSKINDNSIISIDNGGSWSASVDLPVTAGTETSGIKEIKVTDGSGRVGKFDLDLGAKTLTVSPEEGRVGSNVTVKGAGFPSKNNDGNSNTVTVTYTSGASENSSTVTPDASGNFTVTVQVPSGSAIPSTNIVKATYDLYTANTASTKANTSNITTGNHNVPSASVTTNITTGGAGTSVTATGTGFKRYTTVTTMEVGDIDVTPSPKPTTDTNGGVEFDFIIPGTDTGVQTVELTIGGTTASIGFTVTDATVSDVVTATADALEPLLTAGTLASAFYYDNATKEFQFHIVDDAFADANSLVEVQGGEPLWIEVTADTTAELAGTSFDLTCVNGDCFNLIVFP